MLDANRGIKNRMDGLFRDRIPHRVSIASPKHLLAARQRRDPCSGVHLLFELISAPAGISTEEPHRFGRLSREFKQVIPRGGRKEVVHDSQFAQVLSTMQGKQRTSDRSADIDLFFGIEQLASNRLKNFRESAATRPIEDQSEGPFFAVLQKEDNRPVEIRIGQGWGSEQEVAL